MSLYLLLSDIHASDKAPASCTDTYRDDILDLLRQTVTVARERQVAAVVWAGDVFHVKAPSRTSYELVNQVSDVVRAYPCPAFIVPGNHDLRHDRLESVDRQPLGALYRAGAVRLEGWAQPLGGADGEFRLYGVPWLQGYGNYWGYDGDDPGPLIDTHLSQALRSYRETVSWASPRNRLVIAHAPLYPPGKELEFEHFPAARWAEAMGGTGYVFYGHVHEPHGVYRVASTWETEDTIENGVAAFCNNGALSRGSLHEYNLTRQVGCTLWDDGTGEFEFVPLAARPASEVFRLAEKQQVTDMQGRLDQFLADVGHASFDTVTPAAVRAHVRQLHLGKAAEDLVDELLEHAEHAHDPDRGRG